MARLLRRDERPVSIDVPLATDYGKAASSIGTGGILLNLYARPAPVGARAEIELVHTPGSSLFAQLESAGETNETNINAIGFAWGQILAVGDNGTYLVSEDESWSRIGEGLSGNVSLAFNGSVAAAVNGTDAKWITQGAVTGIADPNFYTANTVTTKDGFFVFDRAGTQQLFHSEHLAQSFDALDIAAAERFDDDMKAVRRCGDHLWAFGTRSTEVFYNAGESQFTFRHIPGLAIEYGIASVNSIGVDDDRILWLTPFGRVMMATGLSVGKVSDSPIEDALVEVRSDWESARAYIQREEGHTFYILTIGYKTFAFDLTTRLWHQRGNYTERHVLGRCGVEAWGRNFVGDHQGRILETSRKILADSGDPLISEVISQPYAARGDRLFIGAVTLHMDTPAADLTTPSRVSMEYSDDGGFSWSSPRYATIQRTRRLRPAVQWRRLGYAVDRRFRWRVSDPIPRSILATATMEA